MGSAYTTTAADAIVRFQLNIAYDKFIWTTDPKHEAVVKEFYSRVLANCDIYNADYEDLFCFNCEEYKDEKDLLENHCCPIHLKPRLALKEDNYFFALSKYQKSSEETLTQNPDFVQPLFRLNEVTGLWEIHPSQLELKSYDKVYICNGCKELGIGSRYRCKQCNFDLHEADNPIKISVFPIIFAFGLSFSQILKNQKREKPFRENEVIPV